MAADPTALFTVLDDRRVQATELSRGPWDARALHGGPVAALAARSLERVLTHAREDGDPTFTPARFTLELERPVGLDPLTIDARVTRPGRSVRTAELDLHDDSGRRLARATLVVIRERAERLDLSAAVLPDDDPPPQPEAEAPQTTWRIYDGLAFHRDAVTHSFVRGSFDALGPATDWIRLVVPVVDGEEASPLQRVVAAADFGNGISAAVPHATHTFINPDLTVVLHRAPVAGPIGVASTTRIDGAGIGSAEAELWDTRGRIGRGIQTLVVDGRA
jgi:acyl-coenzyme A thioesterase PaaI-like protein